MADGRAPAPRLRALRGLRLIHTHLRNEPLTRDDLTDLSRLRLDMVVAVCVGEDGRPGATHSAHLLPDNPDGSLWDMAPERTIHELAREDFLALVQALEAEILGYKKETTVVQDKNEQLSMKQQEIEKK